LELSKPVSKNKRAIFQGRGRKRRKGFGGEAGGGRRLLRKKMEGEIIWGHQRGRTFPENDGGKLQSEKVPL